MDTTTTAPERVRLATGIETNVRQIGTGDPLVLVMGTSGSLGVWGPIAEALADKHRVISFDNRGMGGADRGDGAITMASLAQDVAALLDALDIERAHVLGWSLGSAVAQELALAQPDRLGALVLYATWAKVDVFQTSVLSALRHPWESGDLQEALTALGMAFSPEFLNSEEFPAAFEQMLPLFPQTPEQIRVTCEQWQADLEHDTLDRLGQIAAPTLVIAGEQDLLTPPWQCKAVADEIPGARYECLTGPGSSHALMMERPDEFLALVAGFLAEHPLS